MIIEAGYDVMQLLDSTVNKNARSKRGLWLLVMDEYLRFQSLATVAAEMKMPVEAYIDEVSAALRREPLPPKYIVLAYRTTELLPDSGWLFARDEKLTADGWLGDVQLLGQVVFDRTGYFSTVPRFRFRDYIGLEDLPRSASVLGPHEIGCECVACVHFEQMLYENRKRREANSA